MFTSIVGFDNDLKVEESKTDNVLSLELTLPSGFEKKHIKVSLNPPSTILISGERKTIVKATKEKKTRSFSFSRIVNGIDPSTANARIQDGKLVVSVEVNPVSNVPTVLEIVE